MDPATIMMIISTALKAREAVKTPPPQAGQAPGGQAVPPVENTASKLAASRAEAAGQPSTRFQEAISGAMQNPGVTPQLEQNLARQQQQKPTLEEVEARKQGEGPGTMEKVQMGAEIGQALNSMRPKPPRASINFGGNATAGPAPTALRFRRDRAPGSLNEYVRMLLRR